MTVHTVLVVEDDAGLREALVDTLSLAGYRCIEAESGESALLQLKKCLIDIVVSETTIDNCYDVRLENEDYTMGKVLEYILYTKFYEGISEFVRDV